MRPFKPAGDVSFHLIPAAENLFPDSLELSGRPTVTYRGVGPDAVVRSDAGMPGLPAAHYRRSRRGPAAEGC